MGQVVSRLNKLHIMIQRIMRILSILRMMRVLKIVRTLKMMRTLKVVRVMKKVSLMVLTVRAMRILKVTSCQC